MRVSLAYPLSTISGTTRRIQARWHSTSARACIPAIQKEDNRQRLSQIWAPAGGFAAAADDDSHAKLIQAGFIRQAHSGIFHVLPLGRRVQDKLEALIDKYMSQLGASKLALSSISSEELWSKSGRLDSVGPELFRFKDRKDTNYILSPTHEEEITSLVASAVTSYKDLPVRLYQISRKYRDELRPRHGLLRTREFVMKDLYTFDYTPSLALATYDQVKQAYSRLFDELKLPYLVAEADSGDMGGNLSHEFHFPTSKGEDHIISCNSCNYVANEELAECSMPQQSPSDPTSSKTISASRQIEVQVWRGVSRDRSTLINVWYSQEHAGTSTSTSPASSAEINVDAVKSLVPDLDASRTDALSVWANQIVSPSATERPETSVPYPQKVVNLIDCRLPATTQEKIACGDVQPSLWPPSMGQISTYCEVKTLMVDPQTQMPLNLMRIRTGDLCPRCPDGRLEVQRAIELGHTFHLGTRYSQPLAASVAVPSHLLTAEVSNTNHVQQVILQMGCHGIGVSRMIGAVAETLADDRGLNWPRVMAPFDAVVVPGRRLEDASLGVYDMLTSAAEGEQRHLDLVIDDRSVSFPWKLRDADMVGYPIIVIVGRQWRTEQVVEIQCRRLNIRQNVKITEALNFIYKLLLKL